MNTKALIFVFLVFSLFVVGCGGRTTTPQDTTDTVVSTGTEDTTGTAADTGSDTTADTETTVDGISGDEINVSEIEDLETDLDLSDLDSLDQELADLENLDLS